MKPYTRRGEDQTDDELRKNWRGNKNRRRKVSDRPFKKAYRKQLNDQIRKKNKEQDEGDHQ